MDAEMIFTLVWLVVGVVLIGSEALHASFTTVFLGAAALGVAGLRAVGLVDSLPASLIVWMLLSAALTIPLRPLALRYLPSEKRRDPADEDSDARGQVVDVIETVTEVAGEPPMGRIRFQGSTWPAVTTDGTLPKGSKARLVYRERQTWVVDPVPELEGADVVPVGSASELETKGKR
jgi:membrane protein implicated in regulation of membrane protease activity